MRSSGCSATSGSRLLSSIRSAASCTQPRQCRPSPRGARSTTGHFPASKSRSEEHTSELQSPCNLVCRLLLEKKKRCKKEFNYLEGRENQGRGFRYVIAKLDGTTLPGFAQGKIFVDFSERREGPVGSDILRLLHGLAGEPLPEKAVRLAAEVDEEVKKARSAI